MMKMEYMYKKNLIVFLVLVFVLFSVVFVFYAVFGYVDFLSSSFVFFYSLARFFGLVGFLCISFLIISGDLARFFDSFFGIDKIIKFQRRFAIFSYFVVFFHPLFFLFADSSIVFPVMGLGHLAGVVSLFVFAGIMVSSLLYKSISYKAWQYIHVFSYVLFVILLFHVFSFGSSSVFFYMRFLYFFIFTLFVLGVFYRTRYKLNQRRNKFFVKDVKWQTKDSFSIIIESNNDFLFEPGQFCFLRLEVRGLYSRHPFTISSRPLGKEIEFCVKITGKFTEKLSRLKKGDEVKIEGPFGNFVVRNKKSDLVFVAGGVGISPFMSLLRERLEKKQKQNVLLLYGSRTFNDIIFRKEIDSIKEKWFNKVYFLSEEKKQKGNFVNGFIDKGAFDGIKNIKDKLFYICGPEAMKKNVISLLRERGVMKKNIFVEDFFW